MRIIKPKTVEAWSVAHAAARTALKNWMEVVRAANWKNFADVRQTYRSADQAKVASGRAVVIFDVAGNRFRLIAAIHYRTEIVFALRFLTHAEYSKDKWKDDL
jgi:mRNA interferase HigB